MTVPRSGLIDDGAGATGPLGHQGRPLAGLAEVLGGNALGVEGPRNGPIGQEREEDEREKTFHDGESGRRIDLLFWNGIADPGGQEKPRPTQGISPVFEAAPPILPARSFHSPPAAFGPWM